MNTAKNITLPAVFTALLLVGQFVLSGISGVEVVTVLLLCFAYRYGIRQGLIVANAFSLLRCFIFGFMPNVLVLYLVYYNLFVLVFGGVGNAFKREYSIKKHVIIVALALVMTTAFTLLDNVITPLIYSYNLNATKAYFIASLYTLIPHLVCSAVTVSLLFPALTKVLK